MAEKLKELRKEIDRVNSELLKILSNRGKIVSKIGELKRRKGIPLVDDDREDEILKYIISKNEGPYSAEQIKNIFREILRQSVDLQREEE